MSDYRPVTDWCDDAEAMILDGDWVAGHLARLDRALGPEPKVARDVPPTAPRPLPPPTPIVSNRAPSLFARLRELPGWRP